MSGNILGHFCIFMFLHIFSIECYVKGHNIVAVLLFFFASVFVFEVPGVRKSFFVFE